MEYDTEYQELNEMEEAYAVFLERAGDEVICLRVLADPDGTTYPACVDYRTGEVLALLCIPPRIYAMGAVN